MSLLIKVINNNNIEIEVVDNEAKITSNSSIQVSRSLFSSFYNDKSETKRRLQNK